MGKGIANLYRYAEVSRLANHRYLDALAQAGFQAQDIVDVAELCRPLLRDGRHVPALNPVADPSVENTTSAASPTGIFNPSSMLSRPNTPARLDAAPFAPPA